MNRQDGHVCTCEGKKRRWDCEHFQVLPTNLLQTHWGNDTKSGKGCRHNQFTTTKTKCVASLDVKTAFDVALLEVSAKVLQGIKVHGDLTAAMLADMQHVRGTADFEA